MARIWLCSKLLCDPEGHLEEQTLLVCNQVPSFPILSTSEINTAVVMDSVFANQRRGARHLTQTSTAAEIRDGLRNFLPNPSDAQVLVSLMPVLSDCALQQSLCFTPDSVWLDV